MGDDPSSAFHSAGPGPLRNGSITVPERHGLRRVTILKRTRVSEKSGARLTDTADPVNLCFDSLKALVARPGRIRPESRSASGNPNFASLG